MEILHPRLPAVSSVFTLQLVGIMDPISLLIRSLSWRSTLIQYATASVFNALYAWISPW